MHPDHITSAPCSPTDSERWLSVADWPGYEISDLGRARSYWTRTVKTGLGLRPEPTILVTEWEQAGAIQIILSRNLGKETRRAYVCHLVLEAFVGPRPPKYECCHFDGDNKNNRLNNLRWDTKSANMLDRLRHGTTKSHLLKEADIPAIWARLVAGENMTAIGRDYAVSFSVINQIKRGGSWGHITRGLPGRPTFRPWNRPAKQDDPPFRLAYRP